MRIVKSTKFSYATSLNGLSVPIISAYKYGAFAINMIASSARHADSL